ncbi:hypothetical protein JCM8097_001572 [Rhodosporidiobolus ruineniae]
MSAPSTSSSPPLPDLERAVSHGVVQHRLSDADGVDELTFPQLTQAGPPTDAYLETSPTGIVAAKEVEGQLAPSASSPSSRSRHESHTTLVSPSGGRADPEKGLKEEDAKLVTWKENDPENPRNWSMRQKWLQVILASLLCFNAGFSSAIITGGLPEMANAFSVSNEVINLSVCLFVVGFGLGPLFQSPLSEMYGRRVVYLCCMFFHFVFTIPECVTHSLAVLLVFRFLAGLAVAGVMCNAAGSIGDVFAVNERGNKMATFSAILFASPCLGPLVGGYITITVGWRWMWWVLLILSGVVLVVAAALMKETYHPTLLKWRAEKLRKETGDETIQTEQERQGRPFSEIANESLLRPLVMLFCEPIMTFFSMYLCLIYGLLYGFFFAFPIVFIPHGWNSGEVGLAFLSILLGIAIVAVTACPLQERYYQRQIAKCGGGTPPPEARLPLMMGCCVLLPISLFMFAGTSVSGVHPAGLLVSGVLFGFSLVGIYISANTYLSVAFSRYAASAMAAKTFIRSMAGASMPMWVPGMYHQIGHFWSGAAFAFIAVAMSPIPFVFFFYGGVIRAKSKMAS